MPIVLIEGGSDIQSPLLSATQSPGVEGTPPKLADIGALLGPEANTTIHGVVGIDEGTSNPLFRRLGWHGIRNKRQDSAF